MVCHAFRIAYFEKNGTLRKDIAWFINNTHTRLFDFPELRDAAKRASLAYQNNDPLDRARDLFARQQAEFDDNSIAAAITVFTQKPLISILLPVYNSPPQWLDTALRSVINQRYSNWELCIVDDGANKLDHIEVIEQYASKEPRIKFERTSVNGGISRASNRCLELATGEYSALFDHDDELTTDALFHIVKAINENAGADFIYTDECKIGDTADRNLFDFNFKPAWSPEIMFNFMITGHLSVYSTALVKKVGGFRTEFDFSQDYDLALRASEAANCIVHIDRVLYHWRAISGSSASGDKDYARISNIKALRDAPDRRGISARAEAHPHANVVSVALPTTGAFASIIIPSDSAANVRLALDAIRKKTDYEHYEVCVVCNSGVAQTLTAEYADWPTARFIIYDKPYNFSDKCNAGAQAARGDILVFYNDDVFPIERDWLQRLIEYLWVPGVGATSPQLLYENGNIQYAGMISGTPGTCGTAFHGLPHGHSDKFLSYNRLVRNISILSGACCAVKQDLFHSVGGFDAANTPDGHSDLDLSYKILAAGLRCVYTPYSLLTHVGNHSWDIGKRKYKGEIFCLKR